jgi:hypothetical protein
MIEFAALKLKSLLCSIDENVLRVEDPELYWVLCSLSRHDLAFASWVFEDHPQFSLDDKRA